MMRAVVWSLLSADSELSDDGIDANSLISTQAVDTPNMRPFAILVWGTRSPGASQKAASTVRNLTVWVHDEPADYTRIDRIIERIKTVLGSAAGLQDTEGGHLTQADWTDDSADLADDGYGTITRSTSFRVIGSSR